MPEPTTPLPSQFQLLAEWTDDCNGKKDYDAPILSLSTRYWPRGGGLAFTTTRTAAGVTIGDAVRPEVKPSAKSEIQLEGYAPIIDEHGETSPDHLEATTFQIAVENFEAETEEEVKQLVEEWAQAQMDRITGALTREFISNPIEAFLSLACQYTGVDLQCRKDERHTAWPKRWRARLCTTRNEQSTLRFSGFGDTPEEACVNFMDRYMTKIALQRLAAGRPGMSLGEVADIANRKNNIR